MQKEFSDLVSPYLSNELFCELRRYNHHNTNRLNHSYNVAVYSYWLWQKLNRFIDINLEVLLIGALLHDFYFVQKNDRSIKRCMMKHAAMASKNAKECFDVSPECQHIIETHMFPVGTKVPCTKEAWLVVIADDMASIMERLFNKNFELPV